MSLHWWHLSLLDDVYTIMNAMKANEVTKPQIVVPETVGPTVVPLKTTMQVRKTIMIAMNYARQHLEIPPHKYFLAMYYLDIYLNKFVHLWEDTGLLIERVFHMAYASHESLFIHQQLRFIYPFPPDENSDDDSVEYNMRNIFGRHHLDAIEVPTPYSFFDFFGHFIVDITEFNPALHEDCKDFEDYRAKMKEEALTLLYAFMEDFKTYNFILPSHQASMAVYITRFKKNMEPWPPKFDVLTGYTVTEMIDVVQQMHRLQFTADREFTRRWG